MINMGYMRHHMIVVTTYDQSLIQLAHAKAQEIFGEPNVHGKAVGVTDIMQSPVNHYYTFFVPTDGSKEGWPDSDQGDERRVTFVEWLNHQRYEDQSSPFKWAEVQYGDDERDNRMLRHDGEVAPNFDSQE
jgi:hypothetical protein